jgi:two-component system, cell cycle sensor histidine kinase and response regulator CckA
VKHKEMLLLVEDESTVRSVLSDLLAALGYRCIVAANAIDAMRIIEANLFRLDLLVSDIKMPGELDGLGLAEKMRALQPDVAILLISAYAESPRMQLAASRGYRVLEKPFRQAQLEAAIADALGEREDGAAPRSSVVSLRRARDEGRD